MRKNEFLNSLTTMTYRALALCSVVFSFQSSLALADPTQLVITGQPLSTTGGANFPQKFFIEVRDAANLKVTTATNPITIAIANNPAGGTLAGTLTVNAVNGVAQFYSNTIDKAGNGYTLIFTSAGLSSATSNAFNITVGPVAKTIFSTQPSNATAGTTLSSVVVTLTDKGGNTVTSATNNTVLSLSGNPGGSTFSGTLTQAAVNGIATFSDLSLNKTGVGYRLSSTVAGLTATASGVFNITAGAPNKLGFTAQPMTTSGGLPNTTKVSILDAFGNVVTSASPTAITLAIGTNPSSGTLAGSALTVSTSSGVATFSNFNINKAGSGYTLTGSASGLTQGISSAFDITVGPAAKIAFSTQPSNTGATLVMSPAVKVSIQDAGGNTVTSNSQSITLTVGINPGVATLSGTLVQAASSGVATFDDLSLNKSGNGYTLKATLTGLPIVNSNAFNINFAAATQVGFTIQPTNTAGGSNISVKAAILDSNGNIITSNTTPITLSIGTNPSGGTLKLYNNLATITPTSGVASFNNFNIDKTGSGYTLSASAAGLTTAVSNAFDITVGSATKLVFTSQPTTTTATTVIDPIQVTLQDAGGNTVTSSSQNVTLAFSANALGATLSGTLTRAAVSGVATFDDLSINKSVTAYRLAASATGLTTINSSPFNTLAGSATKLAFLVQPTNTTGGFPIPQVVIAIQDAQGNTVTSAANAVSLGISVNPSGGSMTNYGNIFTATAVNGIASFNSFKLDKAGVGYKLTAAASGLTPIQSNGFDVTVGPAAKLAFTAQPTSVIAGASINPSMQVAVQDLGGNTVPSATTSITVEDYTTSVNSIPVFGTATKSAVNGIATFNNISMQKVRFSGMNLKASATGLISAKSNMFFVAPGTPYKLIIIYNTPDAADMGATWSHPFQVGIQDVYGNFCVNATNTISLGFDNNPTSTQFYGTNSMAAFKGVATFQNMYFNATGSGYRITATSPGLLSATSDYFDVGVGSPTKVVFTAQPQTTTAGTTFTTITATIKDQNDNIVTNANNPVPITLDIDPGNNPTGAVLFGTQMVYTVNGVANFSNISIRKKGNNYKLKVSSPGLTTNFSNFFNISAGVADKLAVSTQPSNASGGAIISPAITVQILDAYDNLVGGSSAPVTFAIQTNPNSGTLTGTTTVNALAGLATFSDLKIDNTGNGYVIRATSGTLTGINSNTFNIGVGAPSKLAFIVGPSNTVDGVAITPAMTVQIQDAGGNLVTNSTATVGMEIKTNPGGGTLSGTTAVSAVGGVATFNDLSINKTGTGYVLTTTSTGLTSKDSSAFNITVAAASKLAFTVQPSNAVSSASNSPAIQVSVEDANGNVIPGATNSITVAIGTNPSGGTLSGTTTVSASSGVASFSDLAIDLAGSGYTLTASASGLTGATSTTFNITSGGATKLVFSVQPTNAVSAIAINPSIVVLVQDAQGNTVSSATDSITLAIGTNPGGGTLAGSNPVSAIAGVATFSNISIDKMGVGYTLTASASGLTGATSSTFNISAAAASKLAFTTQPTNTASIASISPAVVVGVQDAQGNTVTNATNSIAMAIGTNPGGGTLAGTTPVSASSGIATFSNLSIDKSGSGYTLTASATGLTGATSSAFNITATAASKLAFTTQPTNTASTASINPAVVVTVQDAQGNTVTSSSASIAMAIGTNPNSGTLSGTTPISASSGVATFSNLSINSVGTGYTLTAAATGLTGATSSTFNITSGAPTKLVISYAPTTISTWSCSNAITVVSQDVGNNATNVGSTTAVNLTSTGSGTYYSDADCLNSITSITIASGSSSSASFYYKDNTGESVTLTSADAAASLTSGTKNLTVGSGCIKTPSAMVSWWNADIISGSTLSDVLGVNNGTLTGGATTAAGKVANACSLSGSSQFVDVANSNSLGFTNALTVVAWVNSNKASGTSIPQTVVSKWKSSTTLSAFNGYDAGSTSGLTTKGYTGGVFDGRYIYYAPYYDGSVYSGKVLRFDTTATFASSGSWIAYDASSTSGLTTTGYYPGVFDGRYVYFAPYYNGSYHGKVLRYDTTGSFTASGSWTAYDAGSTNSLTTKGYIGAIYDGRYVIYVPFYDGSVYHGRVLRYDTTGSFTSSGSWTAYDAGSTSSLTTTGFLGATFDGRYIYFAPYGGGTSGNVLRYDTTASFSTGSSWTGYNASSTSSLATTGFYGAVFDGRYVYFVPHYNGAYHANILRYDTTVSFTTGSSWTAYNAGTTNSLTTKGMTGATFDGRYIYFNPYNDGTNTDGKVLRYDTMGSFTTSGNWTATDAGTTDSLSTKGFIGSVFDGRYIYFSPHYDNGLYHGRFLRYDTTGTNAAFSLKYSVTGYQGGFGGSNPGSQFLINTTSGARSIATQSNLATGWHQLAGTYDGSTLKIYVDGALSASRSVTGNIITNTTNLNIGGTSLGQENFNGLIDEAQVYNRTLAASEIQSLYGAGTNGACSNGAAGAASQLAWTSGPTSILINACNAYTVSTEDANRAFVTVGANKDIAITGKANGTFYSDSGCTTALTNNGNGDPYITMTSGTGAITVYYKNPNISSNLTLTASTSGLTSSSLSVTSSTGTATQLAWTSGPASPKAVTCNSYTVTSEDAATNPVNLPSNTSITLSGFGSGVFYSDACSTALSTDGSGNYLTTISSGTSSKSIYFKDATKENLTFNADDGTNGMTAGTKAITMASGLAGNFGDGADGALTVSSNQTVNSYASLSGNVSAGANSLSVDTSSGFAAGKEVLVIGMEGSSSGTFEFANVSSVSAGVINLTTGLVNAYVSGTPNTAAPNGKTTQIVLVPHYTSVTVNTGYSIIPTIWTGSKGGVVIFRATGTVTVNGSLDASAGYGFSGGSGVIGGIGYQGRSYYGTGVQAIANNYGSGGGGGGHSNSCGSSSASGGGGGGYSGSGAGTSGSCGPLNPCSATGGASYGSASLSTLFMGSGGGGGGACTGATAGVGGNAAGIIVVYADTINTSSGTINVNGGAGGAGSYGGGGAAGGSVLLVASTGTLGSNRVTASGGSGGSGTIAGGAGSTGRIATKFDSTTGTTSPAAGTFPNAITPLTSIAYLASSPSYIKNTAITANTVTPTGTAPTSYSVSPALPAGLSLNTSTGTISGTPTAVTAQANYVVLASNSDSTVQVTLAITVNDAAPTSLAYSTNPASYIQNSAISANGPSNSGGLITTYSVAPALPAGLTLNTSTGIITGTPTTITAQATYVVTGSNVTGSTNVNLVITITGAPAKLAFNVQPMNTELNTSITPALQVLIQDSSNATVVSSTANVTIAIGTNPASGTLAGTLTVAAVAGVATFNNLSINNTGVGYTLTTTSGALTSATSNAFNIVSVGGPTKFAFTAGPASTQVTACVIYTVTTQNGSSSAANVSSNTTVTFTGIGSALLYSDACVTQLSKDGSNNYITTIASGTSSKNLYFKDSTVESLTLTADDGAGGYAAGTKAISVASALSVYYGDGADGSLSVSSSQSINSYAYMSANNTAGATSITVDSVSGFAANQEVLFIETEGPNAGRYEFGTVSNASGTTINLTAGLKYAYDSGTPNTAQPNAKTTQIVTVPHYTSVTVNGGGTIIPGQAWNGNKGGIVIFRANGTITINGSIDVSSKGFAGGNGVVGGIAYQGNSYNGKGTQAVANNYGGGGGGGGHANACGSSSASGGAGGAFAAAASNSSGSCGPLNPCSGTGGAAYGAANLSAVYFGSGGGGGGACTGWSTANGAASGGIVMLFGSTIDVTNGTILSNGGTGGTGNVSGGGGSGGSIILVAGTGTLGSSKVTATGGAGGTGSYPGTAGSAGRIAVNFTSTTGTANPAVNTGIFNGPLTALAYATNPATYTTNVAIANNTVTPTGDAPTSYSVSPSLPAGLSLSSTTGTISGTPTSASSQTNYVITGTNANSNAQVTLPITVSTDTLTTNGLVLNLDASKYNGSSFGGTGCSTTTWTDLSASALNGTLTGFSSCGATTGWNGSGATTDPYLLAFDGTNDYVNINNNAALNLSAVTIEAWAYPTSTPLSGIVDMAQEAGYTENYSMLMSGGTVYFQYYNGGWISATYGSMFAVNTWVHVVITYSGGTATIYKNGSQVNQATSMLALVTNASNTFKIGRYQVGSQGWFPGKIEEVRIYNRALTSTEVSTNCNARKARFNGFSCP